MPVDESVSTNGYHIYGIISEGSTLTERVVCLGVTSGGQSTTFQAGAATPRPTLIEFNLDQPYVKLFDPPQKGITVSGDETYRLNFNAFDWGYNANVGIFAVKVGAGELVSNGNFNNGSTGWTIPADWTYGSGVVTHTTVAGVGVVTPTVAISTLNTVAYTVTYEIKNATAGTVQAAIGAAVGALRATNGVYSENITALANGANLTITPATNFDGSIDNISVKPAGISDGGMTTTVTAIAALPDGNAYNLTSTGGTLATGVWITENTATYYDMTLRLPSDAGGTVRYTNNLFNAGAGTVDLSNGDYWIYIGAGLNGAAPVGATNLYRAPGILTIKNLTETPPQRNLLMSPMSFVSTIGDTTRILVNAADEGGNVDLIDAYIAVEKQYFDLLTTTNPFTDPTGFGTLIANEAIDDSANGRWILHATVFNSGNVVNPGNTDLGSTIASFLVKGKGTNATEGRTTSIYFINEPVKGWVTDFKNDGVSLAFASSNSNVKVKPRGIVEGVLDFQGRVYADFVVNFDLRKRGSYEATTDTVFINTNDGAIADSTYKLASAVYAPSGIQYKLDTEGKFTLLNVPTGDWELVVSYPRYLAKMQSISLNPGLDSLFVNFGELLGGDAIGYTDSLGDVYPNNAINQTDIDRISEAYLSTPDSSRWATAVNPTSNGKYNYKWADVNEDNVVEIQDLTIATGNFLYLGQDNIGAQPVYQKPAAGNVMSNVNAIVEILNIPSEFKAGQSYTLQIVVNNAADVKGYFVGLNYNSADLSFSNIEKGNFINTQSQAFPVIGNGTVGFANAVYGPSKFSGSGILAEITFTAIHDGVFSSDMLSLTEASFVNSNYVKEEATTSQPTNVDSGSVPVVFNLDQNYPNPFNPSTTISFAVPENGHVSINIYDVLGRKVRTLVDNQFTAGKYSIVWDAKDGSGNVISAGVYMYAINAGKYQATKRMLFLK